MSPKEVKLGKHKVGLFDLTICRPVFDDRPEEYIEFFELMLVERSINSYVDLIADERFDIFKSVGDLTIPLTETIISEYNYRVITLQYSKEVMPTIKLHRITIANLMDQCRKWKPPKSKNEYKDWQKMWALSWIGK